jgi:hypothetical protein
VWFDDKYKEFFYTREPTARFLDMGNITQQLEMKKRLNCKSFAWFMEEVAYDVLDKYPELPANLHWGEVSMRVLFSFVFHFYSAFSKFLPCFWKFRRKMAFTSISSLEFKKKKKIDCTTMF